MSLPRIRLVMQGPWGERVYEGSEPEVTVGRSQASTVRIEDDKASRLHCCIRMESEGFCIADLESSNGTFVNEQRIVECPLVSGDVITIGRTTLVFQAAVSERDSPRDPGDGRPDRVRVQSDELTRDEPIGNGKAGEPDDRTGPVRKQVANLKTLLEINRSLISELDKDRLWERIIDTAIELTGAERGFLILFRENRMVFEVARNLRREEVSRPEYEVSRSIARGVVREDRALITADAVEDDRFRSVHSVAKLKLRSILCVPLRQGGQPIGALYLDNRFEAGLFAEEDVYLVEAFAAQATLALNNADLFAALKRSRDEVATLNRALKGKVETQKAELKKVRRVLRSQQDSLSFRYNYSSIVGRSPAMAKVLHTLDRITATNLPVLIAGESGTGKELVARAIHFNSPRVKRPFVSENCAAIPASLFESELFGYVKGAFTGASQDREGLIELADGGTVFLDEIGDLDLSLQKKLLRVLQEGEVRRLGDKRVRKIDVRFVSATNRNLERLIQERRFREDLFYRLCAVTIHLPPLRERAEDIPLLADHFLERFAREPDACRKRMEPAALRAVTAHDWPGNVRELENELKKAWYLAEDVITEDELSPAVREGQGRTGWRAVDRGQNLREVVDGVERQLIQDALQEFRGNKSRAAEALGLSRVGLRKKMVRLGLLEPSS